jgi:hypothetical protein
MTARVRSMVLSAALILVPGLAFAGPPLLCHPYDIGSAASLPWGQSWADGMPGYDVAHLVSDTEALLGPQTPVIVRMETLRRAAIYASRDGKAASALLDRLTAKARASQKAGRPDALALLDAAYVAGALDELVAIGGVAPYKEKIGGVRAALGSANASSLIAESLAAQPNDPTIEFAAALIASDKDHSAYEEHARRAKQGASKDPLLARNLSHIS